MHVPPLQTCTRPAERALQGAARDSACVQDKLDMVFGAKAAPCALAQLNSLGAINLDNNRMFSAAFSELLAEHDIPDDRCSSPDSLALFLTLPESVNKITNG